MEPSIKVVSSKLPDIPRSPQPTISSQTPSKQSTLALQLRLSTRRSSISSMAAAALLLISAPDSATALPFPDFNFNMVAPEKTVEEAMADIRVDAEALLSMKSLIEAESWGDAQKSLRRSSALLKKDVYALIQSKPGSERPVLRKLYSELFNGVSRLDYAARDRDKARVEECYARISAVLREILSKI